MKNCKIIVKRVPVGWRATLYYKWWFLWIPWGLCEGVQDYKRLVMQAVIDWKEEFNIPKEKIIFK